MTSGAYGLRFRGSLMRDVPAEALAEVAPDAPVVDVEWRAGSNLMPTAMIEVQGDRVVIAVPLSGRLEVRRDGTATYYAERVPAPDLVVHPLLSSIAAARTVWDGRVALHGGVVELDGRLRSLVGPQGAGKSSLLAALHARGHAVLSDDLTVLDAGTVRPGPRTLDLRPAAAEQLGERVRTVSARDETRSRLALDPVAPATQALSGVVLLEPSGVLEVERLRAAEALPALAAHVVFAEEVPPRLLLQLARIPVHRIRRPLRWGELGPTMDAIERLAQASRS